MADEADVAQYHTEQLQKFAGVGHRALPSDNLPITGRCHNCGDAIPAAKFCDEYCREDWEKRRRARTMR